MAGGTTTRRKGTILDQDRVFSRSSASFMRVRIAYMDGTFYILSSLPLFKASPRPLFPGSFYPASAQPANPALTTPGKFPTVKHTPDPLPRPHADLLKSTRKSDLRARKQSPHANQHDEHQGGRRRRSWKRRRRRRPWTKERPKIGRQGRGGGRGETAEEVEDHLCEGRGSRWWWW